MGRIYIQKEAKNCKKKDKNCNLTYKIQECPLASITSSRIDTLQETGTLQFLSTESVNASDNERVGTI